MSAHSIFDDELTLCSALFASGIIIHLVRANCRKAKEAKMRLPIPAEGDSYYQARYQNTLNQDQMRQNLVVHFGKCHCSKVQFKILAPRILHAVDIPSKLRFPRVTVHYHDFELIDTDMSVLSMYTVQQNGCNDIGIHSFCSYCGMQILYAPCIDPIEVQINLDCLEPASIESSHVAYHSSVETMPCSHPLEDSDSRGIGYNPTVSMRTLPTLGMNKLRTGDHQDRERERERSPTESSETLTEILFHSNTLKAPHHISGAASVSASTKQQQQRAVKEMHRNNRNAIMTMEKGMELPNFINCPPPDFDGDAMSVGSLDSFDPRGSFDFSSATMMTATEEKQAEESCDSARTSPSLSSVTSSRKRYSQVHSSAVDYNTYQQMKKYLYRHLEEETKSVPSYPLAANGIGSPSGSVKRRSTGRMTSSAY